MASDSVIHARGRACLLHRLGFDIDGYPRAVRTNGEPQTPLYEFPIFEDPEKVYTGGELVEM